MIAEYLSGVAGGIAVVLVGHPFDTTKTRIQTAPPGFYSSTVDCLKKTIKREGNIRFFPS
jgi:solute carrier family 25 carnitine/acylcarnitine transporter 20/29